MNPKLSRGIVLVLTTALAWGALVFGRNTGGLGLQPGQIAQRDYFAQKANSVLDEAAFAAAQDTAAAGVAAVTERDLEEETAVQVALEQLFDTVQEGVVAAPVLQNTVDPVPLTPETTTTTQGSPDATEEGTAETSTTTTIPEVEDPAVIEGFVFLDVTNDSIYNPDSGPVIADAALAGVDVLARSADGTMVLREETQADGTFAIGLPPGTWDVGLLMGDPDLPSHVFITSEPSVQNIDCGAGEACLAQGIGVGLLVRSLEEQATGLKTEYGILDDSTIVTLVAVASDDLARQALRLPAALDQLEQAAITEVFSQFGTEIEDQDELRAAQNEVTNRPPIVFIDARRDDEAGRAVADIAASFLRVNTRIDEEATEAARQAAREDVDPNLFRTEFPSEAIIVEAGNQLTSFHIDAIRATGAADTSPVRSVAVAAVLAVLVASLGFYLSRFRKQFWESPRMVTLFGLLLVLAAGSVRLATEFSEETSGFILPAVAFGYLAAVLFDNRMGTIMAVAMAILAAVGTRDPGVTVYAALATLAPIGFVSRVSSRRSFRNSVLISSAAVGFIAAAVAWMFVAAPDAASDVLVRDIGLSVAWAVGASLVASLVALAAMPFFESMFDVTTTLRLLELTDRNHEALELIQESAFGTFNHSLMVGTLADAAARSIGANNLLARAAAYYHDIGKTENPLYYIENQFGIPNPHDDIPPDESARIVRQHVLDGVRLAKRYGIPSEVSEGILAHHGDAIMRYFYEKARNLYGDGNVDPDDYRHAGHKPRSSEMAIVMLADSVEGACRAVFGDEEPTFDAIAKVVNRVVDEKVADGQLSECDITLGELTTVRNAFIEALAGHYHRRIQYPNFPGS